MRPRHAVLLTPSASSRAIAAPFCTDHCSLTAVHYPLSPLDATLMGSPASVANKRLTVWLNPLDATLTKNRGWGEGRAHHQRKALLLRERTFCSELQTAN